MIAGMVSATPLNAAQLGIERDGEAVRLTLSGENGQTYTLEAVEAFLNGNTEWRPVATVAPVDGPVFLSDPICSVQPQNFYRMRLIQNGIPVEVNNFRLVDTTGRAHELYYQSDARAVVLVFAGPDLDSIAAHAAGLAALEEDFGADNVRVWILAVRSAAGRDQTLEDMERLGIRTTVLEDEGGAVTRALGRGIAPEALVFNPLSYSIVYRGRITDAVGEVSALGNGSLLADALARHLEDKPVVIRETTPLGTALDLSSFTNRTYSRDIAPLLQNRCVPCHSPGNIAPWAMTNHAIVRDYAPLMKDEILTRRMPPWHADRRPLHFANDSMLSGEELAMLVDWIDRGAPRGEGPDPLAEEIPEAPPEWPLGTPDQVVTIETQSIPAVGVIDYRYVLVPNPFPDDVWLRAAVVRPGNRQVVHHVLVFAARDFNDILQIQAGLGGYFAGYVPGLEQVEFPEGTGKLLRRGAFLVFQLHYTANGRAETDATQLGLYLAPTPPPRELLTSAAYDLEFAIPPGESDHPATASAVLPRDGFLYEMSPHMHYRGKRFKFEALFPDGSRETLLNVPFYRFDWQSLYRLAEPRFLPAGTRIVISGAWDNSWRNPYNPDATITVEFGEQSWEEMFIGYFNWAAADEAP